MIAAVTLASSMLTISRDCVPEMRAKLIARLEPSDAVNESEPVGASELSAFSAIADISGTDVQRPADHAGLIRRRGDDDAGAVDQQRRNSRPPAEIGHDLRQPVDIDAGDDDGIFLGIDGGHRIGRHHHRPAVGLAEQIVAEDEVAGFLRLAGNIRGRRD